MDGGILLYEGGASDIKHIKILRFGLDFYPSNHPFRLSEFQNFSSLQSPLMIVYRTDSFKEQLHKNKSMKLPSGIIDK